MTSRLRAALTLSLIAGLLAALPASGAGVTGPRDEPVLHIEELRVVAGAQARQVTATSPAPCRDGAYKLTGSRWRSAYRWSFRASTTPAGLGRNAAEAAIRRGFTNITAARNDCGRADRVAAAQRYLGPTSARPSCSRTDGRNVVGFRPLAEDVAARACWWMVGSRIVEADVQINSTIRWATSLSGCVDRLMLEAVMTHEAGHVFGLDHVGEGRHGRLTMSTFVDGPCNNQESTLGLGDMRGLEALYP